MRRAGGEEERANELEKPEPNITRLCSCAWWTFSSL